MSVAVLCRYQRDCLILSVTAQNCICRCAAMNVTCLLSTAFCSSSTFCCRCATFQIRKKKCIDCFLRTHQWEKTKRNHVSWFLDFFVKNDKVNLHSGLFTVSSASPHPCPRPSHAVVIYQLRVKDTCLWVNRHLSLVVTTPSGINLVTLDTLFKFSELPFLCLWNKVNNSHLEVL